MINSQRAARAALSRSARVALCLLLLAGLTVVSSGCEDDLVTRAPDGQWVAVDDDDGGIRPDSLANDLGAAPDGLPTNKDGPKITIETPAAGAVIVADVLPVRAKITHADGVDPATVMVTLQGRDPVPMAIGDTPDTFEALLDVGKVAGKARLWVTAADLAGRANSAQREFSRDPGPTIEFLTPLADGRHKGSVSVQVLVYDPGKVTRFEVRLGNDPLVLTAKDLSPKQKLYSGTIVFDDPFDPPLSGRQVLTGSAENEAGARSVVLRVFFVDDQGPQITAPAPVAGQVVGGVVQLAADFNDLAGVLVSSVRAVIGNDFDTRTVKLNPVAGTSGTFTGQFDTRSLPNTVIWPVVSFRAADTLGNEAHHDIQIALDNGPPVVSLDPSPVFHMARYKAGVLECSHPFDPVGSDAANDGELVPQVVALRARVEDQGNPVPSAKFVPVSLVDQSKVWMYVLDDTNKALLVDTTGDGFCDSINPEVVPLGGVPQPGEAVAVNLGAVPPSGAADYTSWADGVTKSFPAGSGCNNGSALIPPDPLCFVSELTRAPFYTGSDAEPALFTIPPAAGGDKAQCLGLPFDFGANVIENGWVCVAIEATDNVGNKGVSLPLRLWVDKGAALADKGGSPPTNAGVAPDCTGTLNAATGVVDASKNCTFRPATASFPQVFPLSTVRAE